MDPKPSSDVQQWKRSNYGNIVFDSVLEMSATHPNKAISIVMGKLYNDNTIITDSKKKNLPRI